ncbi:MAG: Uncharacterised protein [Gammaproteobacteria bacterium]|nr:MAG: Uncharacterised protein [Gammaproteobacteria bacterium]|tara:strand:- start:76 stop:522 length:447 start_codon:yes stop_codon:yes gene_type:complete
MDLNINLQNKDDNRDVKVAVDFLVPFTNTLVNLLSKADLSFWDFKKELNNIKITNIIDKDIQIESNSIIFNFKVYILYSGTRNFILKIEGISEFSGFCIMVTNKGMAVNHDAAINSLPLARELKEQFLLNYKSPYLLTETYLNFLNND